MAKHRTLKRALSILLVLCFVMSIFTVNVFADEGEKIGEAKPEISSKAEQVSKEVKELLRITKESLYLGIDNAVAGKHLGDISSAVQDHCEAHKYGIVRELTGHGIGREMHEDPQVPNYGRKGNGVMLKAGMCLAIEPMITMGERYIWLDEDRWSVRTRDGKPAAHFEHTIAVRKGKAEILSSFEEIEKLEGKLY